MTSVEKIRAEIKKQGGLNSFSSSDRKNRPVGCPMQGNMKKSLQGLSKEEIHVAFRMGLIGNNNREGSIVKNSKA